MREKIFISYNHADEQWIEQFKRSLSIGVYKDIIEIWTDHNIETGSNWNSTIAGAIATAKLSLLLVTKRFLESKYIATKELSAILHREKEGGLEVWWVPVESVTDEKLGLVGLYGKQAAWNPKQPLAEMDEPKRVEVIEKICSNMITRLGLVGDTNRSTLDEIKNKVSEALGVNTIIKETITDGDFSIIYKAQRHRKERVVKAIIPSPRRTWLSDDFVDRAAVALDLRNPAFMRIFDHVSSDKVRCIIMEFVTAPTLQTVS